ncbi:MAG: lipid IV(A) 3-deoxy-D-manno-octulosonic acid transferase [Proteobacteria bacterium]|nr:lipid IV(A) 3-deoxy-D-manno-octulosonic acid transferase [Pseudomonadota bacterium]
MRIAYSIVLYLLAPLVVFRLFWLGFRNPDYRSRWTERFGFPDKIISHDKMIWLHAVSVGEVQAARPLVNALLEEYPDFRILITTMTPTGADCVRQYFADTVEHFYLPYDLPMSVKRFLSIIDPIILIVMETELWPNLFHYCQENNVPVVVVNARMSERSAKAYRRLSSLTQSTLKNISLIIAQGQKDAERLIALGADREKVKVTGNLKFDINFPHSVSEQAQAIRRYLSVNRPVWIAASTHEGEERIILDSFAKILEKQSRCLLVIVPRHPERSPGIKTLCNRRNLKVLCKTENAVCDERIQVFILDTLGELPMYYAAADVAFVGGSFTEIGGHNMLEPASLGVPVIMGPHVFNFQEISQLLLDERAAWKVSCADELSSRVCGLLDDANLRHNTGERGRNIVLKNRGNVENVMKLLRDFFRTSVA